LQIVVTAYPGELAREELAGRAGFSSGSGSFVAALAKLRKLDLLTRRGLRASETLMASVRLTETHA
jgi:hypothetical protein